jgi:hypothetical protein
MFAAWPTDNKAELLTAVGLHSPAASNRYRKPLLLLAILLTPSVLVFQFEYLGLLPIAVILL